MNNSEFITFMTAEVIFDCYAVQYYKELIKIKLKNTETLEEKVRRLNETKED